MISIRALPNIVGRLLPVVALALVPLALLSVHFAVDREFEKGRVFRHTVGQAVITREHLSALLALHLDIETGVRGYVLTGNALFLDPFVAAAPRRKALLATVDRDVAGDPRAANILADLEQSSERQFQLAAANYSDAHAGRSDVARERIASGAGKRAMDAVRGQISALDDIEQQRLNTVTTRNSGVRHNVQFITTMLISGLAILLAAVTFVVGKTTRQRQRALAHAEQLNARQQAMFDGAVDGMMLLDGDANILKLNPSIIRMFGYSEDELLGQRNTILMDQPSDLETSRAFLTSVGAAGVHGAGERKEITGRRKDGSRFETEVAISRVSDETERRYIAAIRDISEAKRAEAMKNEFVSTVSHELRTPLTSIGGSLGLLAGGAVGELNDKAARLVAIAHKNCERLIRLINDILDIEKIESGKMHFAEEEVDLGKLILRTVAATHGFAAARGISLFVCDPPRRVEVRGDDDRLEQLLTNLVSNAIKHSPEGETVEVSAVQAGSRARIEVRDRGAGVPEDFRSRIFGKFAMADGSDSRVRGGTGLGLAIAREIAHHHGGTVSFADRVGGGTVFWTELPVLSETERHADTSQNLPHILHVDDDRDCLSVIASAFEGRAAVLPLSAMKDARRAIQREKFAGAVIDVGMREEDGTSLIPLLRQRSPNISVVVFSARDEEHLEAAADAVLIKSRSAVSDVVETMMKLIAQQKAPHE